jgi:hypothetical protein
MDPATMLGPLDTVLTTQLLGVELIKYLLVVFVLANMGTRALAYRRNVSRADDEDAERAVHHPLHAATTVVLVLATFYFATWAPHGGTVLAALVLGLFITDFFEVETWSVDIRKDQSPRRPKGALVASLFVLAYATFQLASDFQAFSDTLGIIL